MTYDWAQDAINRYTVAIEALRGSYLKERLEDESAKEWLARTGRYPPNDR